MFQFLDRQLTRAFALLLGLILVIPRNIPGLFTHSFFLFLASLCLTFALMPWIIAFAKKIGALDYPDARRVHQVPTPRIGGLAVIIAVNITLLVNFDYSLALKGVVISSFIVGVLSFWDDIKPLSASIKLLVQFVAIIVLLYCDVTIHFAPDTWWGYALEYALTAFWMIGITNAFNFLDGINGLASALAATTCLLMGLLAWHTGQPYMLFLCLAVAGGAVGFLADNARYQTRARTFLGDVGSTYLGWIMAAIAVMGDWSGDSAVKAYAAPLLIFSVMIFDMIYTTIARIVRGDVHNFKAWIEYVGKDHLHHRLMDIGCTQLQAVLLIVSFSVLMGLSALALVKSDYITLTLLLIQAVVFYLTLSFFMLRVRQENKEP